MKKIILFVLIIVFAQQASGNDSSKESVQNPDYIGESDRFVFYSNYWLNMHHFLYHTVIVSDTSAEILISEDDLKGLSDEDAQVMNETLHYYKNNMIDKDLRTSDYMYALKWWMVKQSNKELKDVPAEFQAHVLKLLVFDKIYKNNFWTKHNGSNKKVVSDYMELIKSSEKEIVEQLSSLSKSFWQSEKIRVDLSYYGKRAFRNSSDRPYTTIYPTHIVMNSWNRNYFGNWLELLYHEASHHLISSKLGFIGGTISDISEVTGLKVFRQLWHAYLFYFSGKATQAFLKQNNINDYELYMVRNKVFTNAYPYLEKHLANYMAKKKTLAETTLLIIKEMNEK